MRNYGVDYCSQICFEQDQGNMICFTLESFYLQTAVMRMCVNIPDTANISICLGFAIIF